MEGLHAANIAILIGAGLVLFGIISSLGAARFGAPLLLVFMAVGMLAGEDGPGGIEFENYQLTYLIGSLALSVVLFDGGLRTRLSHFRGTLAPALLLSTVGVAITAAVAAVAAYYIVGFFIADLTWLQALLLGSVIASTDAAAVFFLLRTGGIQLQRKVGAVLETESATNDPMAVFLTIILTELLITGHSAPGAGILLELVKETAIAGIAGVAGGAAMVWLLNRFTMPTGLHPLFVVAAAVLVYSATQLVEGSGFLAVYLAGLVMANRPVRAYPAILGFHDAASWLSQIAMFTMLGLLVTPSDLIGYAIPGIGIALVLTFVARPAAVWACLHFFGYTVNEKHFVSWVGLRGAVSIFLAAIPTLAGAPQAEIFFNTAFFVVLVSLLVQGWTLVPMARRWGMATEHAPPNAKRVEVDIPGQLEQELVGYPVEADSTILTLARMPTWLRTVMVIRDGEILTPDASGQLQPGDYVYLLAKPDRVIRLDMLFEPAPESKSTPVFGEFPLRGDVMMRDVCSMYDLSVSPEELQLSVAAFVAGRVKGGVRPGARVPMRRATLVVREVENGRAVDVGLQLEELMAALVVTARGRAADNGPLGPWIARGRRMLVAARRRMGRRARA